MKLSSHWERLFEEIGYAEEERAFLRAACAQVPPHFNTRTLLGFLIWDTFQHRDAVVASLGKTWLEAIGHRFSTNSLRLAVVYTAFVAYRIYPELSLSEGCAAVVREMIVERKDHPFFQMFIRATGGSWDAFVDDFDTWQTLFAEVGAARWSVLGDRHMRVEGDGLDAAAMSLLTPGSFQGLMAVYGVEGEVTCTLEDNIDLVIMVRW